MAHQEERLGDQVAKQQGEAGDIGGPRPGGMLGPLNLVVIIIIVTYDMHLIQGTEYKFDDSKSPSVPESCVHSMKDIRKSLQDAKLKTEDK
ncbi:hypothetical protein Tco_0030063 [Tanacetum coccineum]